MKWGPSSERSPGPRLRPGRTRNRGTQPFGPVAVTVPALARLCSSDSRARPRKIGDATRWPAAPHCCILTGYRLGETGCSKHARIAGVLQARLKAGVIQRPAAQMHVLDRGGETFPPPSARSRRSCLQSDDSPGSSRWRFSRLRAPRQGSGERGQPQRVACRGGHRRVGLAARVRILE